MTREENIKSILECHFTGFKEELIDNAVKCICDLSDDGEYIKKEDAIAEVEELKKIHFDRVVVLNKVNDRLNALPTYSFPDREKGEWIKDEKMSIVFDIHKCSRCSADGEPRYKFCPNCGADMKGKADE